MMMRALYTICGTAMRKAFLTQQELLQHLNRAAAEVKSAKDSARHIVLQRHMEALNLHLSEMATPIPLSLGSIASGVELRECSYFPSNTVPLKLAFISNALSDPTAELPPLHLAIYKVGDDLRQDQLTSQMIRVMDKLWLKEGLDLKMVTFGCVPTGDRQGMVELVTEAKTLREIQVTGSRGVTGSFKDTPIHDYLVKHNPSQLEFARAVNNFTRSCAGYSVITYILGICDRHNDNIMVKQSGHLFHIDFGKFLGDTQMFGNFKRDRTPFVLTPDMVYVINGGDKPTQKMHDFVDICCKSFNIIRKNGNLMLNLFALMASSGIPGVTMDAVSYVQRALLPDLSSTEAAATFSRMIEESLTSWFTQWNFFIHNLGQMRFSGEENFEASGELLSFIPKSYS
jgi:phosphatidylinositol-4-phosphate 3-kinase